MAASFVKQIHLNSGVVYIAGIECPISDIVVTYGGGAIPTATIMLPASSELVKFGEEDRVPVVAFYLDQWYSDAGTPQTIVPTMRLLFDGEIRGWSFLQTPNGDSISFSCIANANMLNNMFANFLIGADIAQASIELTNFSTSVGITAGNFRTFPLILLNQGLFPSQAEPIERPFDFIQNMLFAIKIGGYPSVQAITQGGVYSQGLIDLINQLSVEPRIGPDAYSAFLAPSPVQQSAVMGFFVMYNHRTRFDKRWMATPLETFVSAENPSEIRNAQAYAQITDPRFSVIREDILNKATQRALESLFGQGDSFMKILQTYYSLNAYEILMLPTAPYVLVGLPSIAGVGSATAQSSGVPLTSNSFSAASTEYRLGSYISKPISLFALPPECNLIFPCMTNTSSYAETYDTQVTRSVTGNPFLDIAGRHGANPTAEKAVSRSTVIAWPYDLYTLAVDKDGKEFNSRILWPEEYFKGPVLNNITIPTWYVYLREASGQQDSSNVKSRDGQNKLAANNQPTEDLTSVTQTITADGDLTPEQVEDYAALANRRPFLTELAKHETYYKYTKYSHYEARFSQRQGSQDLLFNPYILPSYPFMRFDTSAAGLHTQGQVVQVSQRLSATAGCSTTVSYSHGRTFQEVAEIVIANIIDQQIQSSTEGFYNTGPIEPTIKVAQTLQQTQGAANYYKQTYYQTPNAAAANSQNKNYVFDYTQYFLTVNYNSGAAGTNPLPTAVQPSNPEAGIYTVSLQLLRQNPDNFTDYATALQRISRPICTLDQYRQFINNEPGSPPPTSGIIPADVYGVAVPIQIRVYQAADDGDTNALQALNHYIVPTATGQPSTIYDMRRDWVSRIQAYRQKIFGRTIQ